MEIISSIFSDNSLKLEINPGNKNGEKKDQMKSKQYVTKKLMGQWENQKILQDKWQWKHNLTNLWDAAKVVLREKVIAIQELRNKKSFK